MMKSRRVRTAADVAAGYAADARGAGVVYAAISTGSASHIVRLTFRTAPAPALEGREYGYAAVAAVAEYLKARGFGHVRVRVDDSRIVGELSGSGTPPKALAMSYVRVRCLLHALGSVRLEASDAGDIRDLAARAGAEVSLHVAA